MIEAKINYKALAFPVAMAKKFAKNKHPFFATGYRSGYVEIRSNEWGEISVVATDGRCLALAHQDFIVNQKYQDGWWIVLSMEDATKLLDEAKKAKGGTLNLEVYPGHPGLKTPSGRLYTGLTERFPDFEKVLPDTFESTIWLDSNFTTAMKGVVKTIPTFKIKEKICKKTYTTKISSIHLSHDGQKVLIEKGRIEPPEGWPADKPFYAIPKLSDSDTEICSVNGAHYGSFNPDHAKDPILLDADLLLDGVKHLGDKFRFSSNGPRKATCWRSEDYNRVFLQMPIAKPYKGDEE